MMRTPRKSRAFTLIELIVVVIIIAVLAAIGVVAYNQFTDHTRRSAVLADAAQLRTAVQAQGAQDDASPAAVVASALSAVDPSDPSAVDSALRAALHMSGSGSTFAVDSTTSPTQVVATLGSHDACISLPATASVAPTLVADSDSCGTGAAGIVEAGGIYTVTATDAGWVPGTPLTATVAMSDGWTMAVPLSWSGGTASAQVSVPDGVTVVSASVAASGTGDYTPAASDAGVTPTVGQPIASDGAWQPEWTSFTDPTSGCTSKAASDLGMVYCYTPNAYPALKDAVQTAIAASPGSYLTAANLNALMTAKVSTWASSDAANASPTNASTQSRRFAVTTVQDAAKTANCTPAAGVLCFTSSVTARVGTSGPAWGPATPQLQVTFTVGDPASMPQPPKALSVAATVAVGSNPSRVAVSPDGSTAYVVNDGDGTVSVIDTATNKVTATIPVGGGPIAVAMSPDGSTAYVTNGNDGTVSVIDSATNRVTATVPVGMAPDGIAVSADGSTAYVVNDGDGTVSVIDTATNKVTATIPVGSGQYSYPADVAVSRDGATAYVTNIGDGTVSVIDTATSKVTATIAVGTVPQGLTVSPDGSTAYVAVSGAVSVIDTATNKVTAKIALGGSPINVAMSPDGSMLYVANDETGSVAVIDVVTGLVKQSIQTGTPGGSNGGGADGVAVSPDGAAAYVVNGTDGTVSVLR